MWARMDVNSLWVCKLRQRLDKIDKNARKRPFESVMDNYIFLVSTCVSLLARGFTLALFSQTEPNSGTCTPLVQFVWRRPNS